MKAKKLIKKIALLFSRAKRREEKQRKELQDALQHLKRKQKELDLLLEQCHDSVKRQELLEKINILKAQRGKGLEKLRHNDD